MNIRIRNAIKNITIAIALLTLIGVIVYNRINILEKNKSDSATINFNSKNWIEIPVKINDFDTFGLFDTGANICAIDKAAIDNFDVFVFPFNLISINKKSRNPFCIIKEFKIGGVTFRNVLAVILDLKSDGKILQCAPSEIIIGTPIINQLYCKFNFTTNSLFISTSNLSIKNLTHNNSFSYEGSLSYQSNIAVDRITHNVKIDLGHTASLVLPMCFANDTTGVKYSNSEMLNAHGTYYDEGIKNFTDIVLGKDTLKGILAEYTNQQQSFLGLGIFKKYNEIAIDPFEKTIYLGVLKSNSPATSIYSFGFSFNIRNNQLLITRVLESSPAHKSGLQHGDTIQRINGICAKELIKADYCNFTSIRDSLLGLPQINLRIKRKTETKISLKKELF